MRIRPVNRWLPPALGLLVSTVITILATAPPGHSYSWTRLLAISALTVLAAAFTCAVVMFLSYVALPKSDPGPVIIRTSATAALVAPLIILLQQRSPWAAAVAALIVWTTFPAAVSPKSYWKKFVASIGASVLLQFGIAFELGEQERLSALILGIASAPVLWRIRQERKFPGPFNPKWTLALAVFLTILSLTAYLPIKFGYANDANAPRPSGGPEPRPADPSSGLHDGGQYRGVILIPEAEQRTILVPPLPMMGRNPFLVHPDPLGIPFYGVYWFFQSPDKGPREDAYRAKGTPERVTFRSAGSVPLKMEAHQNLGRLIDIDTLSRIDIAIRNADPFAAFTTLELVLTNTRIAGSPWQSLGFAPITSRPAENQTSFETISFRIPPTSAIPQFDELIIRFPRAPYRASRSARIAIDRFFLAPRK